MYYLILIVSVCFYCSHLFSSHISFLMADANAIYLSPKPYYLLLINTLRIILSSLLFTTHRLSLFLFYFCSHFGFHHIFHFFMADANAIYLSPKSYYLFLINTLRIISSSLLFTTHHHSLFYFILFYFFLLPHTSLLMADANAMYHPSFIIYYSSTHYLFTYYFLINPFFFDLGWLMRTSFSS